MPRHLRPSFRGPRDRESTPLERSEVKAAVGRFLLVGLAVLVIVATPVAILIRAQIEEYALNNARTVTQALADHAISPYASPALLAGDPVAVAELDARLELSIETRSIVRLKVWDMDGAIVYSDVPSLIGRRFTLPVEGVSMRPDWRGVATIERQNALDNEFESGSGELVEVYVRTETLAGFPLIVEAYYDDDDVRREQMTALIGLAPLFLASLGVLQLAQLLPATRLARRLQLDARRRLLQETIDASERERRNIARELHDDVIQELAGLSYAFEAEKMHATGDKLPLLEKAHAVVQKNLRTLREMTHQLYPPDLEELGLPVAVTRLAEALVSQDIQVTIDIPETLDLDRTDSATLYRVAREVLANITKHAQARNASVVITQDESGVELLITDDGHGFDDTVPAPTGHLGLRIMRDSIRAAGGTLEVTSQAGLGTTVRARLDSVG